MCVWPLFFCCCTPIINTPGILLQQLKIVPNRKSFQIHRIAPPGVCAACPTCVQETSTGSCCHDDGGPPNRAPSPAVGWEPSALAL